ncbi:glycosyltransferase [Saccharopolyspora hirsuta]|uniref:Glycosyltransferase family 1 protein n=1 Tax=Saccharopolyspora hirsuta TaxID=1837 RepID=A0A5M7BLF1_SACHI|nr:glycosyltransferase [Saccharopolyspora hirsuta]KAA5830602.1 glycosyltransferase family 1 protein [Saccharopolyspora hirsuta]
MRVLLSTIGSRGEVQPVVALALQLRALGQDVRVCAPPDFHDWIEGLGIPSVPVGRRMRPGRAGSWDLSTPEGRKRAAEDAVAAQFDALPAAARDRDVLVACGALQVAARSVAELAGIDYVHVHYCPVTLPSPHHAPAAWPGWPTDERGDNRERWVRDEQLWNDVWGPALNAHRSAVGLPPVTEVRDHVLTDRPWLAADPVLGPWPVPGDPGVLQTGAWLLPDERPLPAELESFLDAGEPPVYFGLGSRSAAAEDIDREMVEAARALGRRAIVSRGWAELSPPDGGADCISIGDTNHRALFQRVAAVVHHGGAGTTTTAARAGAPQVLLPRVYDQHYWADRVSQLGIGTAQDELITALSRVLEPDVADRAAATAAAVRTDGALVAARHLAATS